MFPMFALLSLAVSLDIEQLSVVLAMHTQKPDILVKLNE